MAGRDAILVAAAIRSKVAAPRSRRRRKLRAGTLTCCGIALLLAASAALAGRYDYYECTRPDGTRTDSATPCAPGERQRRVTDGAEASYEAPQSHAAVPPGATIAYRCIRIDDTSFVSATPCPRYAETPLAPASGLPARSVRTPIRQETLDPRQRQRNEKSP